MSAATDTQPDRQASAATLARWLTEARDLRRRASADPVGAARSARLRAFQAARLAATHADLLDSPRYQRAAHFFLSDLYGPKDLSARDAEIERVLPIMTNLLPLSGLRALNLAAELDALSERLDTDMTRALGSRLDAPLSVADYAEAYRQVGDAAGRAQQIELIRATGEMLDGLAHKPGLRTLLRTMRKPAQLAGLGELQGFLERGFDAFRSMRRTDEFLALVVGRERQLADALLDGTDQLVPDSGVGDRPES